MGALQSGNAIIPNVLNQIMEQYRHVWFKTFLKREQRMIDTGVMMGLQNGTGFFASCALFAIGGTISMFANPESLRQIVLSMPYAAPGTATIWSLKITGLTLISSMLSLNLLGPVVYLTILPL